MRRRCAGATPATGRVRSDCRRPEGAAITTGLKPASWAYAEEFVVEDEVLTAARERAREVNIAPLGSGAGAALSFLAAVIEARSVVEVGTGSGVFVHLLFAFSTLVYRGGLLS